MKKFTQFTFSADKSIVGSIDGLFQVELETDFLNAMKDQTLSSAIKSNDVFTYLSNQAKLLTINIEEITGKLVQRAKLTDVMLYTPNLFSFEFIVSEKFVDVLLSNRVPQNEYRLFSLNILNSNFQYYMMHVPMITMDNINFQKSRLLRMRDKLKSNPDYLKISSLQEFIESPEIIMFDKVTLNEKDKNKHIVSIQGISNLFISDELSNAIEGAEISNYVKMQNSIELQFEPDNSCKYI